MLAIQTGRCQQNLSTSIAARKLTSAPERSSTFAGAAAVRRVWVSRRLTTWAHVLQHHVAARLLRKAIAHLLADDLALRSAESPQSPGPSPRWSSPAPRDRSAARVLRDRRIAHLRATLVASPSRSAPRRARAAFSTPSPASRLSCASSSRSKRFSDLLPEELALEPVEFVLQRVVLPLQLLERRLGLREHCIRVARAPRRAARSPPRVWQPRVTDNFRLALAIDRRYAIYQLSNHSGSLPVALPLA